MRDDWLLLQSFPSSSAVLDKRKCLFCATSVDQVGLYETSLSQESCKTIGWKSPTAERFCDLGLQAANCEKTHAKSEENMRRLRHSYARLRFSA